MRFSPEVLATIAAYAWPGNVRELRNAIEQSVIMARADALCPSDLSFSSDLRATATIPQTAAMPVSMATIPPGGLNLNEVERTLFIQALERSGGNVSKAARLLGVSRDTLRYRIDKYQLRMPI